MSKIIQRYLFTTIVFVLSYSLCVNNLHAAANQNSNISTSNKASTKSEEKENESNSEEKDNESNQSSSGVDLIPTNTTSNKATTNSEEKENKSNQSSSGVVSIPTVTSDDDAIVILLIIGFIIVAAIVVAGVTVAYRYIVKGESLPTWAELGISGKFYSKDTTVPEVGSEGNGMGKMSEYEESGRFSEFNFSLGIRDNSFGIGMAATIGDMSIKFLTGTDEDREYIEIPSAKYALIGPEIRGYFDKSPSNLFLSLLSGTADHKKVGLMVQGNVGLQLQVSEQIPLLFRLTITQSYIEMKSDESIVNSRNSETLYGAGIGYAF